MKVFATAEVLEINGKRILVKVDARDEKEPIASGTIERYITGSVERFLERTYVGDGQAATDAR